MCVVYIHNTHVCCLWLWAVPVALGCGRDGGSFCNVTASLHAGYPMSSISHLHVSSSICRAGGSLSNLRDGINQLAHMYVRRYVELCQEFFKDVYPNDKQVMPWDVDPLQVYDADRVHKGIE